MDPFIYNDAMINNMSPDEARRFLSGSKIEKLLETVDETLQRQNVLLQQVEQIRQAIVRIFPEQDLLTINQFLETATNKRSPHKPADINEMLQDIRIQMKTDFEVLGEMINHLSDLIRE